MSRNLYVSEEAYLKAEKLAGERKKQIVGYQVGGKVYKHSRDSYKTAGLVIAFASWILVLINAPSGYILCGIGVFVYSIAPSGPTKKMYLCDTIKWQRSYTLQNYKHNKCPDCGSNVEMAHHLVTKCSVCDLHICKFGSELKTAKGE